MATGSRGRGTTARRPSVVLVLVGGGLALVNAVVNLLFVDRYAGAYDSVTVTETEVFVLTAIGGLLAAVYLWVILSDRRDPSQRTYLFVAVLAVASGIVGLLVANVITLIGAVYGWLGHRRARRAHRAM